MDEEDSTLSIDGNLVEDLSKISHTLGLNENTLEVKTEWTVTSSDGEETVYILRESATPTEYTQVQVLSPASGLIASIEGSTITVDYDYRVTAPTAEIQLKSDTNPQLVSEIITLNLEGTFSNPTKSQTLTVATVGGTYSQEYSINITYAPEVFSFSTGYEFNDTHPGPHVLAGYLTFYASDTGTAYILVKETGEAAPDFATLKAEAPDYQTYNLKKEQPQWSALVNLEPETEYNINIGIEYDGKTYIKSVLATTVAATNSDWGLLFDEDSQLVRKIEAYEGQGIVLPSLSYNIVSHFQPEWIDTGSGNEVEGYDQAMSEGYSIIGPRVSNIEILGSGWPDFQYHMWVFEIPSGPSGLYYGGQWQVRVADATPNRLIYEIEIVQGN